MAELFTNQSGLYYYNARYYDAEIGRFISPDTIVPEPWNPQSLNRYSYCLNNPLKYVDPSGNFNIFNPFEVFSFFNSMMNLISSVTGGYSSDGGSIEAGTGNSSTYSSTGSGGGYGFSSGGSSPSDPIDPIIEESEHEGYWDMYGFVDEGDVHAEGGFYKPGENGYAQLVHGEFDSHIDRTGVGYEAKGDMVHVHGDFGDTNASIEASVMSVHNKIDTSDLAVQYSANLASVNLNFTDDSGIGVNIGVGVGADIRELEFNVVFFTADLPNLW